MEHRVEPPSWLPEGAAPEETGKAPPAAAPAAKPTHDSPGDQGEGGTYTFKFDTTYTDGQDGSFGDSSYSPDSPYGKDRSQGKDGGYGKDPASRAGRDSGPGRSPRDEPGGNSYYGAGGRTQDTPTAAAPALEDIPPMPRQPGGSGRSSNSGPGGSGRGEPGGRGLNGPGPGGSTPASPGPSGSAPGSGPSDSGYGGPGRGSSGYGGSGHGGSGRGGSSRGGSQGPGAPTMTGGPSVTGGPGTATGSGDTTVGISSGSGLRTAAAAAVAAGKSKASRRLPGRPGSPAAAGAPMAVKAKAGGATQARRANLVVARLEPWSVMKFSFLISLVSWLVLFVAVAILYYALSGLGVFASLQRTVASVTSSQGTSGVNLNSWLSAPRVLGYTMLVGAVNVVLITALATIGSVIYNLVTHLGGGIEVTLKESE